MERLSERSESFRTVYDLSQQSMEILLERKGEGLAAWVEWARAAGVNELKRFALGLRTDWEAVLAGLALEWTHGQSEATVNRIETIKRKLYGQANLDLLQIPCFIPLNILCDQTLCARATLVENAWHIIVRKMTAGCPCRRSRS